MCFAGVNNSLRQSHIINNKLKKIIKNTPGVAYSLLITGKTLKNQSYIDCAVSGMKLASKRLYDIFSPSFCHGLSGVAYICNRFYEETNISYFRKTAHKLANDIMEFYNDEFPLVLKILREAKRTGNIMIMSD